MPHSFSVNDRPDCFGRHFIVGISGPTLSDDDKRLLSELKPGGIVLLPRNFSYTSPYESWREDLSRLLETARTYAEREKMIVAASYDGGSTFSLPEPLTSFPVPASYAKHSIEVGRAIGRELRSLGVNVNFAPMADINSDEQSLLVGARAFSSSADTVAHCVTNFSRALMEQGVLACVKHFPGHGGSAVDSRDSLPEIELLEEELYERELVPFIAAIKAGIPMLMTAHVMYSRVDTLYPATLSEAILGGLLRDQLRFKGVVVSDDLDKCALDDLMDKPYAMGRAFTAGCDLYVVAREKTLSIDSALRYGKGIYPSLKMEKVTEEQLFASNQRVTALFEKLAPSTVTQLDDATLQDHRELLRRIGNGTPSSAVNS